MRTQLLFTLTFQLNSVVWAEKLWGGTPARFPCPSLSLGAKLPFQQGSAPGSRRQQVLSGCSGAAARLPPTDLSHATGNPSIYTKTQTGVGVSGSVFPIAHVAVDILKSQFQEWRTRSENSHSQFRKSVVSGLNTQAASTRVRTGGTGWEPGSALLAALRGRRNAAVKYLAHTKGHLHGR